MTKSCGGTEPGCGPLEILRLRLRVPVFTAACVCLGVSAHIAAGGSLPSAAMVLLMVAAVAVTSASLQCRERGLPSIVLAVGLVQLGMHAALLAGHEHATSAAAENRPAMLMAAQACAVVALAWWLRRGEAAAWRATVKVWRRLFRLPSVLVSSKVSVPDRRAPWSSAPLRGAPGLVLPVRGPPA
jgi:hypothetical protein